MKEQYYVVRFGDGTSDYGIINRKTRVWEHWNDGYTMRFDTHDDAQYYCDKLNKGEPFDI